MVVTVKRDGNNHNVIVIIDKYLLLHPNFSRDFPSSYFYSTQFVRYNKTKTFTIILDHGAYVT